VDGIELEKHAICCDRKKAVWLRCFSFVARSFGLFHHIFGTRFRFDESTGRGCFRHPSVGWLRDARFAADGRV